MYRSLKKYLSNCFLLTIPVLLWNIAWTEKLPATYQPAIFWNHIPLFVTYGENIFRTLIFLLAGLMPLSFSGRDRFRGWTIYGVGIVLYFLSWLVIIYCPDSQWSNSLPGFMAPAYTPLIWLGGIGQIGHSFYFNLPFTRWIFYFVFIAFLLFHNAHTYLVYVAIHQ